ncbi:hypothetical protein H2200_008301 [Cladophialophora chaetospira]|uniref:Telomeric repeat-binding factor 2-interacting protein 1 n=1 Tax=Cladophialophora chaetospira TaxID=386627 RepID=A0AA38X5W9_9EURO|nr:hypothetical protein H2200_008301 [Cladophialophora chaetospira]
MSSHIVYEGVSRSRDNDDDDDTDILFAGQKLWFAHAMPQRKWLIENAERNGAVVVDMDVDADVRLVDHAKKTNAPGTYSYKYVEASIRNGVLEDLASHAIGAPSRVSRPVGSIVTAPKPGRTPFTPEEDQLLWNWVKPFMDKGGAWKGNEIYKQLEAVNPRHTFQSWRDRWIKHTQYQKRQITDTIEPQDPPPAAPVAVPSVSQRKRPRELLDDGEAQRARQDQEQRAERSAPSRRSPARRVPQTSLYTYEDAAEDAERESAREDNFPQESRGRQVEERTLSNSLSREVKGGQIRSRVPPAMSTSAFLTTKEVDRETGGKEQSQSKSDATPTQGGLRCAVCYITDVEQWQQDAAGRILCPDCKTLAKGPASRQASLMLQAQNDKGEVGGMDRTREGRVEKEPLQTTLESDKLAAQSIPVKQSSLIGRDKQPATKSSNDIAGPSRNAGQNLSRPSRSIRSPSYRPQSPTIHAPESNISKKRSAGKSTQSQSTQPSNPSNENSQNTTSSVASQAQNHATQDLTADMGAEQSTESVPDGTQPSVDVANQAATSVPSFQATSKGKRKRLQDEPTVLPSQQDSSLSTDGAPAGQRSVPLSTDSDKDDGLDSGPSKKPTLNSPSGRFERQLQGSPWHVVREIDDTEEDVDTQEPQSAEIDPSSPPALLKLVSDGIEINADSQSASGRDNEDMDEDFDAELDELVPPDQRQESEEFETAQETPDNFETAQEEQSREIYSDQGNTTVLANRSGEDDDFDMTELPDPPGGFELYGVGASVVPLDGNNMGEGGPTDTEDAGEQEGREQSPEIKLEDGSFLPPRDQPLLLLESSSSVSGLEADSAAVLVEAQDSTRQAEESGLPQEEAAEELEANKKGRIDARRGQTQRLDEARIQAEKNAERRKEQLREVERPEAPRVETAPPKTKQRMTDRRKAQAQAAEPSSTTAVDDPPVATSSSKPSLAATPEYDVGIWLEEQLALYPKVRVLEPILFQAVSATGYRDADLTTQVVTIMVENRKTHIKELRRETGKKVLSNAEIDALDHEAFLPRDMRGVWTKRDDEDLTSGNMARQDRMWAKHGRTKCNERFIYLREHA